jgi:uncharacterized membrane protein
MISPRRWRPKRPVVLAAGGAAALVAVTLAVAQSASGSYDLSFSTFAGGKAASGGSYSSQSAIGQSLGKSSSGGSYQVNSGFLGGGSEKYRRFIPQLARDGSP